MTVHGTTLHSINLAQFLDPPLYVISTHQADRWKPRRGGGDRTFRIPAWRQQRCLSSEKHVLFYINQSDHRRLQLSHAFTAVTYTPSSVERNENEHFKISTRTKFVYFFFFFRYSCQRRAESYVHSCCCVPTGSSHRQQTQTVRGE